MQMIQRRIWGAAAAYNLALGFVPDFVEILMYNATHGSNVTLKWFGKLQEDCAVVIAGGGIYGHLYTEGAVSEADGDTGIQSYEGDKTPQVLVDSPIPGKGLVKASVVDWTYGVSDAATARTGSVLGTIVRPTTHNGYVYECTKVMATASDVPEPDWPTTPGESVVDGDSDEGIWVCREENIVNAGEEGITIGSTLAADGQVLFVNAFKADSSKDLGDVA